MSEHTLTASSTPYEVMFHHPYVTELTDRILSPGYKPVNPAARGSDHAMDNVAMRRHLREFFPDFCRIVQVRELDRQGLIVAIERLKSQ